MRREQQRRRRAWSRLLVALAASAVATCAAQLVAEDKLHASSKQDAALAKEQASLKRLTGVASNIQFDRESKRVRFVRLSKPVVANEHFDEVLSFTELRYLAIVTKGIDAHHLRRLGQLKQLESLYLSNSNVDDPTLEAIAELPKLERVYLDNTAVTRVGLAALRRLPLKTLSVADTGIDDAALEAIGHLKGLEELCLKRTQVTDGGLKFLTQLVQLRLLELDGCGIQGDGLAAAASMTALDTLSLCETPLTASPVKLAATFRGLSAKSIALWNTDLSPAELAELRTLAPRIAIYGNQGPNGWQRFHQGIGLATANEERIAAKRLPPLESLGGRERIVGSIAARVARTSPDFQRHVLPLLGKLGCNGRSCHGSFQGRGGFRLSMFGYDFDSDLKALTAGDHPRVDVEHPDDSLIIYKPTHANEHEGGQRFEPDSWQHQLLGRWIADGAQGAAAPHKLRELRIDPPEAQFRRRGQRIQLRAVAVWDDGTREDVTALTRFQTNDEAVATVDSDGWVACVAPGETHIVGFYDSGVTPVQVMLPLSDMTGAKFPRFEARTQIDRHVLGKLSKLGIVPSPLATDEMFLRRASLDIAGTLPTPADVLAFCEDTSPDKRSRAIERLLNSPAYAQWWTVWLSDLTGSNAQYLGSTDMNTPAAVQWNQWLLRRLEDNVGWDQIAAGILLATSRRDGQTYESYAAEQSRHMSREQPTDFSALDNPMHYYWFRSNNQTMVDRTLSFGYVFLGVRLQCAQCHKHPFDQWSQEDFERFSNLFKRIKTGVAPDARETQLQLKRKLGVPERLNTAALRRQMYLRVAAEGLPIPWNEIWVEPPGEQPLDAKILGGETLNLSDFRDPREPLVAWLLSKDNPYFARAMVNRIWKHYFGVGIVEPPDDFNRANPPSNAALLDDMAAQFVARGYDLKWLHRTICESDAYQRSWHVNDTNRSDTRNFSRASIRRLPAEVTIDAILQATASPSRNASWLEDVSTRKITQHPKSIQTRGIDYSLLIFGKPLRTTNCDCERQSQPTLLQSLYVRNDAEMLDWIQRPDGWLVEVAAANGETLTSDTATALRIASKKRKPAGQQQVPSIEGLVRDAYLRTLCRLPTESEQEDGFQHIARAENRSEGLRDLLWALLNAQEFLTNH